MTADTGTAGRETIITYGDFGDGLPREVYADTGEAVPTAASIPTAGPPEPIRRCELAAIWLAEATAELAESIVDAKDGGFSFTDIAGALGMTPEGVRQRYVRAKAREASIGGA